MRNCNPMHVLFALRGQIDKWQLQQTHILICGQQIRTGRHEHMRSWPYLLLTKIVIHAIDGHHCGIWCRSIGPVALTSSNVFAWVCVRRRRHDCDVWWINCNGIDTITMHRARRAKTGRLWPRSDQRIDECVNRCFRWRWGRRWCITSARGKQPHGALRNRRARATSGR